jgi:tRNA1Val (adenine37-N6)-methyltransferase
LSSPKRKPMKNTHSKPAEDETLDSFYHGRILVLQKKKGYRFSVDAPLLADFVQTEEGDDVLELGTGCGIISLLLSVKPFRHLTAVEIQPSLADLARRNVRINRLEERISVVEQDLMAFRPAGGFDVIFSNPPYHKWNTGHLSLREEKSIAKHELKSSISDIMHKTSCLLRENGRADFIFPAKRKKDLLEAAKTYGLKVKQMRAIYPRAGSEPNLILFAFDFTSGKTEIRPGLFLYDEQGQYTEDVRRIFTGKGR